MARAVDRASSARTLPIGSFLTFADSTFTLHIMSFLLSKPLYGSNHYVHIAQPSDLDLTISQLCEDIAYRMGLDTFRAALTGLSTSQLYVLIAHNIVLAEQWIV